MTESLHLAVSAIAVALMTLGAAMSLYAMRRYGSEKAPKGISLNPRDWKLVYLTRDWFVERKGFWLFITGIELLCAGPLLLIIGEVLWY